jgi:lipopolysaccharide transport system permease protein
MASTTTPPATDLVITAGEGWSAFDLRELWSYRELLFFLVWRDLKLRYRQTFFGAAWAVIQPVLLMAVFSIVLGRIQGVGDDRVPYPLFALAGLVPWTLFSQGLVAASGSLVNSASLIQKVYFPRLLLPIAALGSYLLDFVVGLALLLAALLYFGRGVTLSVVLVIPFAILIATTAFAFGIWLAAINVRYRDVRYAVPFLVQVLLLATPVAYSIQAVPETVRSVLVVNPLAGAIAGFRWALLGGPAPAVEIAISIAVTIVVLATGLVYFRRVERTFADVI